MNWRKVLIEAAMTLHEDHFIKCVIQMSRGIITRDEFTVKLADIVISNIDPRKADEELIEAVTKALENFNKLVA